MPYSQVDRKVEDAVKSLIDEFAGENLDGATTYAGADATEMTIPRVQIVATQATPEVQEDYITGNWTVEVTVALVTNYADTSRADRAAAAGELFDIFFRTDLIAQLNSRPVADLTFYGGAQGAGEAFVPTSITTETIDHNYINAMTCTFYVRPSAGNVL